MFLLVMVSYVGVMGGFIGCSSKPATSPINTKEYKGYNAYDLQMSPNDNVEAIKFLPNSKRAVALSSKSRKLSLIEVEGNKLKEVRSKNLLPNDTTEGETTYIAVNSTGEWAVVSYTVIEQDKDGKITKCGGKLLFIDITDTEKFGTILSQVEVGPMPDSVDISGDDKLVVSANEQDVVWGKCENVANLDPASISILDLTNGPDNPKEIKRILLTAKKGREPESIKFSKDNDLVVVSLQDSHEVALFRVSEIKAVSQPSDADLTIVELPKNSLGKDAWPDGVTNFQDANGKEFFAIAGEGNDTFIVIDGKGTIITSVDITANNFPAEYPRDGSWGPLFVPDSLVSLQINKQTYLAISLKGSGAVGIWNVSDVNKITFTQSIKVGIKDGGGPKKASTIGVEGITVSNEHQMILVANEGESSISLILPQVNPETN
jgi:hypothetical protein